MVDQELRGLRFAFSAGAELAPESSPTAFVPAHVTELSLRGVSWKLLRRLRCSALFW
jgi:hypothetical protein